MNKSYFRMRVVCAAAAVLLTGLSTTVFVSAEPRVLERRITAQALKVERARAESIRTAAALARTTLSPAS